MKCCQILLLGRPTAGDDCDCDCDCDSVILSFYVVVVAVVVSSVGPSVSSVNHSDWAIHFFLVVFPVGKARESGGGGR